MSISDPELNSNIKTDTIDLGAYNIAVGESQNVNVPYTPPMGYTLIGFSVNYPARYVGGIRYKNNAFEGNLYNISNGAGNYGTTAMVLLMKT